MPCASFGLWLEIDDWEAPPSTLREEVHKLVDELTSQQIVSVRMFLEDMLTSAAPRQQMSVPPRGDEPPPPAPQQGRISVDEYRRTLGIGTLPKR